jgi:3-oxoacyl-[acyl-carrier-protein] synthase II
MIALTHARTISGGELQEFHGINVAQRAHFFPDTYKRVKMGISYPPHNLLEKCLDEEFCEMVTNTNRGKTAMILSTGSQIWAHDTDRFPKKAPELHYKMNLPYVAMTQIYAGRLASRFGAYGHVTTDASACASSLKCLMDVANLIENYGFDRVVVVAVDDVVNNTQLNVFGEAGASITIEEEDQGLKPSAFDATNKGFHLSQGAAVAVFDRVHDGMSDPMALLHGQFTASEVLANSIGQRIDGQGFTDAISGAVAKAGIDPKRINIIKTHGTGTDLNNQSELNGIAAAGLGQFVATSYKPRIGHTMGPSGLLETILLLREMKEGQVPAIENRTEEDTVYLSEPVDTPDGLVVSLAAGMGNIYSAAIFEPV